nr:immunoglobulin heavy chain junction region [Macaca mulatta]MOW77821.1 immunoglobulin heavy chain junction region [Macaca mulatta]MOW78296.1 immunoglobulin heavy chain junction region [Macaca mulatta]MOW80539.1 immunoglobulin heavy chain junction region [Macaca mulatta]MOW84809.1 immunoglobulin heavy chain junction region [Macaca mulatta]
CASHRGEITKIMTGLGYIEFW